MSMPLAKASAPGTEEETLVSIRLEHLNTNQNMLDLNVSDGDYLTDNASDSED